MSYLFHIGLRHVVKEDAPFWNCNSIEDVGNAIQYYLDISELKVRELFKPNEETLTGTDNKVFSYIWEDTDIAGIEPSAQVPDGLLERAPQIFEEFGSAPNKCELPGPTGDILIPNLPILNESPFTSQLIWHKELDCRNMEVFGREKMFIGSLDAQILTIEAALEEGTIGPDFIDLVKKILSTMKLAQQNDLFFTFRF